MDKQPEALRLADILQHKLPSIECLEVAAAELRRLYDENQGQAERIQDIYKQLNDTEKEVDDLRAELHEEAKINGAGAERELRLRAELDESKRIILRDEAMLRIAYLAIDKMLPSAFCDEGAEALRQLKERLK